MFKHFSSQHKAILLALLGFSGFSLADAGVKWLTLHYPLYQVIALEQLAGCFSLLCLSPLIGGIKSIVPANIKTQLKGHIFRAVISTIVTVILVYSFTQLPISSVYVAVFANPYIAALLGAIFFAQAIGSHRIIAITIGFLGVVIAFQPWQQSFSPSIAVILILLPILIAFMFMSVKWIKDASLLSLAFWPMSLCAITCTILGTDTWTTITLPHAIITLMSGASAALGVICTAKAFQMGDSAAVSPMVYIQMIWGIALGYIIFGDAPTPALLAGSGIIMISGIYLILNEKNAS